MRRIRRLPLSQDALDFLQKRTDEVLGKPAAERAEEAARLWKLQGKTFQEIREVLGRMASGISRCMYCEDNEGTAVDHFWPKATYPLQAYLWDNYLMACSGCNGRKNKTFPLDATGAPLLLNPVEEEPADHLAFSPSTGKYEALTQKGIESRDIYGLDRSILVRGRSMTWVVLKSLLTSYSKHLAEGEAEEAEKQKSAIKQLQFSGVFAAFLRIAKGPAARLLVGDACLQILQDHPEIEGWL
jgi:uncharacterized protein (TIGR02646 family)